MITVKAIYEKGTIRLLKDAPIQENQHLLITLVEEKKIANEDIRVISLQQPESFKEYLEDTREDLYQDYLNVSR